MTNRPDTKSIYEGAALAANQKNTAISYLQPVHHDGINEYIDWCLAGTFIGEKRMMTFSDIMTSDGSLVIGRLFIVHGKPTIG